jgi:HPt (histidine-containing phosphotransfer) domain-containing protein
MEPIAQQALTEVIEQMWVKFLPQMMERVAELESADAALAEGTLTIEQRIAANSAAHKLAGVLGTFGLTKGTILAREAEMIYSAEPETDPDAAAQLKSISSRLRILIESRKHDSSITL